MDIKFSKDSEGGPQRVAVEEKGKQNVLLVVLLILAAGFGYIYFFTGLIKPAPEQKAAEAPPAAQVVKKPLPSPDGEPVKAVAGGSEENKAAEQPAKPEPVKAEPAPAPAAKPAAKAAANPADDVKKSEVPQASVKRPLPVAAKAGEKKSAPVEKKEPAAAEKKQVAVTEKKQMAAAEKIPLPPKEGGKKTADAKKQVEKAGAAAVPSQTKKDVVAKSAKKEPAVEEAAVVAGRWTVLVGNYVLEEALAVDLGRIRSAGLEAFVVPGAHKKTHMNRLLLADYTDRASAQNELDKLKRVTSDAFILDSAATHSVYAGSYLLDSRAASEKERLAAAGFALTLKRADVAIPSKNLTAGSFVDKKAAEDVLKKLRAAGVKATLSH